MKSEQTPAHTSPGGLGEIALGDPQVVVSTLGGTLREVSVRGLYQDGMTLEAPGGLLDGRPPDRVAVAEAWEELGAPCGKCVLGVHLSAAERELSHLFLGTHDVPPRAVVSEIAGNEIDQYLPDDDEVIEAAEMTVAEAVDAVTTGAIADAGAALLLLELAPPRVTTRTRTASQVKTVRIYLIRHAHSMWQQDRTSGLDSGLSDLGHAQATLLGEVVTRSSPERGVRWKLSRCGPARWFVPHRPERLLLRL